MTRVIDTGGVGGSARAAESGSAVSCRAANQEALQDLIRRVESASVADQAETLREVRRALVPCLIDDDANDHFIGRYHSMLDAGAPESAALALVERCGFAGQWSVCAESPLDPPGPAAWVGPEARANGKTPALALCLALLRALEAQNV